MVCPIIYLLLCFVCLAEGEIAYALERNNQIHRHHTFQGEHGIIIITIIIIIIIIIVIIIIINVNIITNDCRLKLLSNFRDSKSSCLSPNLTIVALAPFRLNQIVVESLQISTPSRMNQQLMKLASEIWSLMMLFRGQRPKAV